MTKYEKYDIACQIAGIACQVIGVIIIASSLIYAGKQFILTEEQKNRSVRMETVDYIVKILPEIKDLASKAERALEEEKRKHFLAGHVISFLGEIRYRELYGYEFILCIYEYRKLLGSIFLRVNEELLDEAIVKKYLGGTLIGNHSRISKKMKQMKDVWDNKKNGNFKNTVNGDYLNFFLDQGQDYYYIYKKYIEKWKKENIEEAEAGKDAFNKIIREWE